MNLHVDTEESGKIGGPYSSFPKRFRASYSYARKYKVKRKPTCGCGACAVKWKNR